MLVLFGLVDGLKNMDKEKILQRLKQLESIEFEIMGDKYRIWNLPNRFRKEYDILKILLEYSE